MVLVGNFKQNYNLELKGDTKAVTYAPRICNFLNRSIKKWIK